MTLTARGEAVVRVAAVAGVIGFMWAGSALGTAVTGVSDSAAYETSTGAGEGDAPAPVVTSSAPAALETPHPVVPKASRSRAPFTGLTARTGGGTLSSTAYCETGLMANGQRAYRGAVAANHVPLGTRLHVSDSPYGPGWFTVADRYGHGTQLDFAMPGDCTGARAWGRRAIKILETRT